MRYIKDIESLREEFAVKSGITRVAEAHKIWARWIITHRGLFRQKHMFLPDDDVYDYQILSELQNKGCNDPSATYDLLLERCTRINAKFGHSNHILATTALSQADSDNEDISVTVAKNTILAYDGVSQELPTGVYNKLGRMYKHNNPSCLLRYKDRYIWLTATLYNMLDGRGLQWALPSNVMHILREELNCHVEIFASPINCMYHHYYSLFPMDRYFGSRGNFFNAPDSDFKEGTYQVNPPFIVPLYRRTTDRILSLLDTADRHNKNLTFIYVMPEWDDFSTYDDAIESRFCIRQTRLESGKHFYFQYTTNTYIRARFGTHVIFLSTNMQCCSNETERAIRQAFAEPYRYRH